MPNPDEEVPQNVQISLKCELKDKSWVDCFMDYFIKASEGRQKTLNKFGTIYVNSAHGYFIHTDTTKILEEKTCSELIFPTDIV